MRPTATFLGMACVAIFMGCGDDEAPNDGGGGDGGELIGGAGGSDTGQGGSGGENRPTEVDCGSETCTGGDVCIVRPQAATCEPKTDAAVPCPADLPNETLCGGAGVPCCCGETPPAITACDPAGQCGSSVGCDCLGDVCEAPNLCYALEAGSFSCEPPPEP